MDFTRIETCGGHAVRRVVMAAVLVLFSLGGVLPFTTQAASTMAVPVASLSQPMPYFFSPVPGGVYTSPFGNRNDPIQGNQRFHAGVDIAAPEGTPIIVPQPGLVVFAGERSGYGNVVVVQHHPMFHTLYAHTKEILVRRGEVVAPGQPIALVGQTGRATGPHLHFETILNEEYTNPLEYLAFLEQHPAANRQAYTAAVAYYSQQAGLTPPASVVAVAHVPPAMMRPPAMPMSLSKPVLSKGQVSSPAPVPPQVIQQRIGSLPGHMTTVLKRKSTMPKVPAPPAQGAKPPVPAV